MHIGEKYLHQSRVFLRPHKT
ncbi:protein of unknown function [Pararobbsia alpina]